MKYFPFSLEQLRILRAIKNEKSLKEAAKKLYISQPAISLQIQKLEAQLDSPLFEREQKQVCFTSTGELILDYAARILVLCEEANKSLLYLKDIKRNKLIIGSSNTTGTYLLPKIIGLFCRRYSYANVKLEISSTNRTSWSVANGQIDIGIVGGYIPKELHQSLQIKKYVNDEIGLILPKFHKLGRLNSISKHDVYDLKFITLKTHSLSRKVMDRILNENKIESSRLRIELELNSIEAIKSAVQAGLGAAFISIFALNDELKLKKIQLLKVKETKINRALSIISNPKGYRSKLLEKFDKHCFDLLTKSLYIKFLNLQN